MSIKTILCLLTVTLIAGCSRNYSTQTGAPAPGNSVRVSGVSPIPPAKLRVGETIRFKIAYSHTNAGPVLITTEPYAKGREISDYAGAASPAYPPGKGEDWSYFSFQHGPVDIDAVRVVMTDFKTHAILVQTNVPLQARWE